MAGRALRRVTIQEIEDLVDHDPDWWPMVCARFADDGGKVLKELIQEKVWSWGAFMKWVRSDQTREAEYEQALKDFAAKGILESIPISDEAEEPALAALRIGTRLKVAEKLDPSRWAKTSKVQHEVPVDLGDRLRRAMLRESVKNAITVDQVVNALEGGS